jgi:hypothetical protein
VKGEINIKRRMKNGQNQFPAAKGGEEPDITRQNPLGHSIFIALRPIPVGKTGGSF